jgi:hypothetical protein
MEVSTLPSDPRLLGFGACVRGSVCATRPVLAGNDVAVRVAHCLQTRAA